MGVSGDGIERAFQQMQEEFRQRAESIERTLEQLSLDVQQYNSKRKKRKKSFMPPSFGERILLLILSKDERVNIPGDLAEEFTEIVTKQGERFAKVWYYKQVAASAWPMIRKAVKLGVWAWIGAWIRRII